MNHFSQTSFTDSGDIHDKQRIEAEDYEELIAEIAERLEVNVEFVTVDCGTRGVALATGVSDIVFWMEIGDWNNFDGSDFEDHEYTAASVHQNRPN